MLMCAKGWEYRYVIKSGGISLEKNHLSSVACIENREKLKSVFLNVFSI